MSVSGPWHQEPAGYATDPHMHTQASLYITRFTSSARAHAVHVITSNIRDANLLSCLVHLPHQPYLPSQPYLPKTDKKDTLSLLLDNWQQDDPRQHNDNTGLPPWAWVESAALGLSH